MINESARHYCSRASSVLLLKNYKVVVMHLQHERGEEQEANSNGLNKQTDAEFQKVKHLFSIFIFITFSNGGS